MAPIYDNPYDDGLDFLGCPPKRVSLNLPPIPQKMSQDCRMICWARTNNAPDGGALIITVVKNFKPDRFRCGVYKGLVQFMPSSSKEAWYEGNLDFYYTRNYELSPRVITHRENLIAFRFVVKGDLQRKTSNLPEHECFILCSKRNQSVSYYRNIFVSGGFDMVFDTVSNTFRGFYLSLGHNDGWYTHHPNCSERPINSAGYGDYIGHYCDRGWLFVSPGKKFAFDPNIKTPQGRFVEEALRPVQRYCISEEAIRYGSLELVHADHIHWYQKLMGKTECGAEFESINGCPGLVNSGNKQPWLTFFSMGHWPSGDGRIMMSLHLVEGHIEIRTLSDQIRPRTLKKRFFFYGFSTQHPYEDLKLVDLASNKQTVGAPEKSELLLYLFNAGAEMRNPDVRLHIPTDNEVVLKIQKENLEILKKRKTCSFLEKSISRKKRKKKKQSR